MNQHMKPNKGSSKGYARKSQDNTLSTQHETIPKGSYMFIADTNVRKFGLHEFAKFRFCSKSKSDKNERMNKIAKAYNMLQEYFVAKGLRARVHFAHAFEKDNKKIHACVIGPLEHLTEGELEKMEHFVENQIPGITSNMVGWQELLKGAGWKEVFKDAPSLSKSARVYDDLSVASKLTENKETIPKGWYMFIIDVNICKVGLPDFKNFYFCTRSKSKNNDGMQSMATAYDMLEEYFAAEGLRAHVHYAYALRNDKKKIYACVIGPLQLLMEAEIKKMEHFVDNKIPGITSNMVGYQLKYTALNHPSNDRLRAVSKMAKNKEKITDDATSVLNHLLRSGHLL